MQEMLKIGIEFVNFLKSMTSIAPQQTLVFHRSVMGVCAAFEKASAEEPRRSSLAKPHPLLPFALEACYTVDYTGSSG